MIDIYVTILISDFISRTFISIQQLQQFFLDARYVVYYQLKPIVCSLRMCALFLLLSEYRLCNITKDEIKINHVLKNHTFLFVGN